jgi:diaminopimelate decarboxylase
MIEPGTFLLANSCSLVTTVQDIATTPTRTFLKLDSGMTEVLRPSLYGAQHPLVVVKRGGAPAGGKTKKYVVVGHCCESGDLLTPAPGEPETIAERELAETAIGDMCVVEGSGAYCSGMATKNYNSFPEAAEVLRDARGQLHLIRARQELWQITQNEKALPAQAAL